MTAEEISNLPNDNILIKVTGVNPFLASKVIYNLPDKSRGIKPMKNVTPAQKQTNEPRQIEEPPKGLPNRMPPQPPKFDF
jgi:Holliday junction resolvasome RuvABC DNA-binding subunit